MRLVYFAVYEGKLERVGPKPKTELEAVDQCIIKFAILENESAYGNIVANGGIDTCSLCILHRGVCSQCVIGRNNKNFGGDDTEPYMGCTGTPYFDYHEAYERGFTDDAQNAARAEIVMLKRLRKKLEAES